MVCTSTYPVTAIDAANRTPRATCLASLVPMVREAKDKANEAKKLSNNGVEGNTCTRIQRMCAANQMQIFCVKLSLCSCSSSWCT